MSSTERNVYCPYLGHEIPYEQATREHIIPLSLGGANGFAIMVDREFNSKVGAEIDGALANDFMIAMKRQEFDAIGHSKKRPAVVVKNSRIEDTGKQVQVSLDRKTGMAIWDPVERRYLTDKETVGQSFSLRLSIPRWSRLRFAAKAALSAGYFLYGDVFVRDVYHEEMRAIMNKLGKEKDEWLKLIRTRVFDQFSGPEEKDKTEFQIQDFLCKFVNGSCIIAVPGPRNIGFTIGVLGQMVGMLNVPARTKDFPIGGDHDLGHAVVLQKGKMFRMSYRALVRKAHEQMRRRTEG